MNSDIRLAIGFWDHPKIVKLERRTGLEGVKSLLLLWQWVAQYRPNGYLLGTDWEDIEIASRWHGEGGKFASVLEDLRLIDPLEGEKGYRIHDWEEHNPWASEAKKREDEARLLSLKRWDREKYESLVSQGIKAISKEDYLKLKNGDPMGTHREPIADRNAPLPLPLPLPVPLPKEESKPIRPQRSLPDCPQDEIIALYREILPNLKQPKTWGAHRQNFLRSRWREDEERQNLEWWRGYFGIVKRSPFLLGANNSGWQADLEWLVRPTNFAKVLDGKYLNTKGARVEDLDPDEIIDGMFASVREDPGYSDAVVAEGRSLDDEG